MQSTLTLQTISSVSIADTAMNVGDVVTVSITASEAGLTLNAGTINGVAVTASPITVLELTARLIRLWKVILIVPLAMRFQSLCIGRCCGQRE